MGANSKTRGIKLDADRNRRDRKTRSVRIVKLAFEGLINVLKWFGNIGWVADRMKHLTASEQSERMPLLDKRRSKSGLRVAVRLRGLPLPALAQAKGPLTPKPEQLCAVL